MNDAMTQAYIEALYFTETGEDGQPSNDEPLSPDTKLEAWSACHRLRLACSGEIDLTQYDPVQIGHDLWLTRNGHGAGFWDRPEIYGEEKERLCYAEGFTETAKLFAQIDQLHKAIEAALDLLAKGDTDTAQCVLNEVLQ